MKKKLLIATDCFLPRWDGIARVLSEVIPHLTEDFDITVVAPDFPGKHDPIADIHIVRIPLMESFSFGDYTPARFESGPIKALVQKSDIIWIHTAAAIGGLAAKFASKYKKPYAFYIHSIDWQLVSRALSKHNILSAPLRWLTKMRTKRIYNQATLLMVPSSEVLELMRWNKIKSAMKVVHLGVDTDVFTAADDKKKAKSAVKISPNQKVIGYVGRLSREKDVLTLYRAFLDLQKKQKNIKLLLVGDGLVSYKEHMIKNKDVIMVGSSDNVIPYLRAMDIFVLPSLLETTSLATLEAMSCEVVPVCTPVGLVKEYVKNKENGLLFPIGNSFVLSLKLEWLLTEDFVRESLGIKARGTVTSFFSFQNSVEQMNDLLQKLS